MNERRQRVFFIAALLSYGLAYFYADLLDRQAGALGWFSFFYALAVELFAWAAGKPRRRESWFWLAALVLQGLALVMFHQDDPVLGDLQGILLHLTAVYYTLVRGDLLIGGETSPYFLEDAFTGLFLMPLRHLFLRLQTLHAGPGRKREASKHAPGQIVLAVVLTLVAVYLAWGLLADASEIFAGLGGEFFAGFTDFFDSVYFVELLFSIPVGMYLFGLAGGTMLARQAPLAGVKDKNLHSVEDFVWKILMTALAAVYLLFFFTSASSFVRDVETQAMSASQVSGYAVQGFQDLLGIGMLNEAVLALRGRFGTHSTKTSSALAVGLGFCSLAFAGLDAVKLGLYVETYGWTLRRFYAVFALCYMALMAVLTMVREKKNFPIVKILVLCGAAVFTFLCLFHAPRLFVFS